MSSAQCSMSSAQCSMSTAQCSMSTAQCSMSTALFRDLPGHRINGTSASSVVRLWRMFAQDELSLGGFPADIVVEDLFALQKRPAQWL